MKAPSVADQAAFTSATATLFLVPARVDRRREGRARVAPLLARRPHDHGLVQRGIHPDLIELSPPEGKERIGIDQVREAIRIAQFSPVQAERKVCLVPEAEALTPEAANALLKTLEEPPRDLAFVLLAEHPGDLLPTIVSRSRLVRVPPAPVASVVEGLREAGYAEDDAHALASIADREGEIDALLRERLDVTTARAEAADRARALEIPKLIDASVGGDPLGRRAALVAMLSRMASQDEETLTTGVQVLASQARETVSLFLQDLLSACFDLVRTSHLNVHDGDEPLGGGSEALTAKRLERMCTAIDAAHRAMSVHGPMEAILLSLFLSLGGDEDVK